MKSRSANFFITACIVIIMFSHGVSEADWKTEGPWLGTISCMAVSRAKPHVLYACKNGGGVWKSEDGGSNWHLAGTGLLGRTFRWLQIAPYDSGVVYASVRSLGGKPGLWKSEDGGNTWKSVRIGRYGGEMKGWRPAFAPSEPDILFLPDVSILYRSLDRGRTWKETRIPGMDVYSIAFDPANVKIVYAGGSAGNLGTSKDGGATWTVHKIGEQTADRIENLIADPETSGTLYAITRLGVYKSTDYGNAWIDLTANMGIEPKTEIYSFLMDPDDSGIIFAATKKGLLKTEDRGATWKKIIGTIKRYYIRALALPYGSSDVLFAGTSGKGIFKSMDGGMTWTESGKGLNGGWVTFVSAGPRKGLPLVVGMREGLFRLDTPGNWVEITGLFSQKKADKVTAVVIDSASPDTVHLTTVDQHFLSTDGGTSWKEMKIKRSLFPGSDPQFNSFVQDPSDPEILYSGLWSKTLHKDGQSVFKSTDGGRTWQPSGKGIPLDEVVLLRAGAPGTIFAVTRKSGIFRTSDGGKNWSQVGGGLLRKEINDFAIDAKDNSNLYAATKKGLYFSGDGGQTWAVAREGIKKEAVNSVVVAPPGIQGIFIGTDRGVFRSLDKGSSWHPLNEGLGYLHVRSLSFSSGSPSILFSGTDGGGVFSFEIK